MLQFDAQTSSDLEFDLIKVMLHNYCHGPSAQMKVVDLTPISDFQKLSGVLNLTDEYVRVKREGLRFPRIEFNELQKEITLLEIRDSVLTEPSFQSLLQATRLVNEVMKFTLEHGDRYTNIKNLADRCYVTSEIENPIIAVFDEKGDVRDSASIALSSIRQEIAAIRRKINRNFNKELQLLAEKGLLGDITEVFLHERRVLSIQSSHKRRVPGMVLGSSKTGTLTYIEPQINVPLNFELEMLIDDERKEIIKILSVLTKELGKSLPLIKAYQYLLVELDILNAKARLANQLNGNLPALSKESELNLIDAFHPILWITNQKTGNKTHPQTLRMNKHARMLVISGPNAGGKSITLKTVGLIQVMLQSGLLVPVHPNSTMCIFQQILTDIGDNQSIENQLSTYSYRLKRMKQFLEVSNRRTLLLLDEFGTGSDPELGGALAEVFFEELYKKKSFGVITTHYGNIKLKAAELQNAINGSMLFDRESLEPLFKLDIGQPGSSFTFEVATINGIDPKLIESAKSRLDSKKVKLDQLISDLQAEKNQLKKLIDRNLKSESESMKSKLEADRKKSELDEKLSVQKEHTERNNVHLHRGKKMSSFIDHYDVSSKNKNKQLVEEVRKYLAVEKSKLEDHKKQEKLKKATVEKSKKQKPKAKQNQEKITKGSTVRLLNGKEKGTVIELEGNQATVAFGNFKTKAAVNKLVFIR
jgi:DNA mismatch repair protein MutS2